VWGAALRNLVQILDRLDVDSMLGGVRISRP
jgi:hypothetical protein